MDDEYARRVNAFFGTSSDDTYAFKTAILASAREKEKAFHPKMNPTAQRSSIPSGVLKEEQALAEQDLRWQYKYRERHEPAHIHSDDMEDYW